MPRPKSLQNAEIAAAALAILDREGLAALSMRSVAEELGVGTMSLYRYVTDREHLERLVVELVLQDLDLRLPVGLSWRRQATLLLTRARAQARRHPAAIPLLLMHRQSSEQSTRWGEALLAALSSAGFRGDPRVIAFRTLLSYLFGALQVDQLGPLSGPGTAQLAQLAPDAFPLLRATARDAQRIDAHVEFERGLEVILRGLTRSAK